MSDTAESEIRELYERYTEEFWNEKNPDVLDEICSPDFVFHGSGDDLDRDGLKAIVRSREDDDGLLSEFHVEIEDVVVEGDTIAARATLGGIADGEPEDVEDYEPPDERLEYRGMNFMRVEDGQFVEEWQMVDRLDLYEQADLLDSLGSEA